MNHPQTLCEFTGLPDLHCHCERCVRYFTGDGKSNHMVAFEVHLLGYDRRKLAM